MQAFVADEGSPPGPAHAQHSSRLLSTGSMSGVSNGASSRSTQQWIEMASSPQASRSSASSLSEQNSSTFRTIRNFLLAGACSDIGVGGSTHFNNSPRTQTAPASGALAQCPVLCKSSRFILASVVHVANLVLRMWVLCIFAAHRARGVLIIQLPLEFIGMWLSVRVTFEDADVRRLVQNSPWMLRPVVYFLALVVLGGCGIIHVKRAWARQLTVAEAFRNPDAKGFKWTGPAVGAERALPAAWVTSVPFALVVGYGYLTMACRPLDPSWECGVSPAREGAIMSSAILSALCVVSLSVVDVDLAVSSYVAARYHLDPKVRGTRAGRVQFLYPLVHVLFRMAEVLYRMTLLTGFIAFTQVSVSSALARSMQTTQAADAGAIVPVVVVAIDFALVVGMLRKHSPPQEQLVIHMTVGIGLMVADVIRYVDMPGFCRPATRLRRKVERLRLVELATFAVVVGAECLIRDSTTHRIILRETRWREGLVVLVASSVSYHALRLSPVISKMGDDLHTAVQRGRLDRVGKLLDMSRGGEALDANGRTKDEEEATPAMLAAETGQVDALRLLMTAGASAHLRDRQGETCLHRAVRGNHAGSLAFLVGQRGAREVLRADAEVLRTLAQEAAATSHALDEAQLRRRHRRQWCCCSRARNDPSPSLDGVGERRARLLALLAQRKPRHEHLASNNLLSVRTRVVKNQYLRQLFPNAVECDDMQIHHLPSVSSLIFAHATGPLARSMLPVASEAGGACWLEELSRVGALGQGACGSVIEVEVPEYWFPADDTPPRRASRLWRSGLAENPRVRRVKSDALEERMAATASSPPREKHRRSLSAPALYSLPALSRAHTVPLPASASASTGGPESLDRPAPRHLGPSAVSTRLNRVMGHVGSTISSGAAMLLPSPRGSCGGMAGYAKSSQGRGTRRFAMKLQRKTQSQVEWHACAEVVALRRAVHPFIVRLEEAFQTPQEFALLLELCPGGDLNRALCVEDPSTGGCFGLPEARAARYAGQVLLALTHLHEALTIVYRDVKPENILISARNEAKLADFGLALYVGDSQRRLRMSVAGTAGYLAPELIIGGDEGADDTKIDPFKTDAYSFGVTLAVMLLGEHVAERTNQSNEGTWMMPRAASEAEMAHFLENAVGDSHLSASAYNFLAMLLSYRPSKRSRLADVKEHGWFLQVLKCDDLAEELLGPYFGLESLEEDVLGSSSD